MQLLRPSSRRSPILPTKVIDTTEMENEACTLREEVLTVTATWTNLDTGASGSGDITAVSTIDRHYGFIGYADTTFQTGSGTVVVTLSSHPGAELPVTT